MISKKPYKAKPNECPGHKNRAIAIIATLVLTHAQKYILTNMEKHTYTQAYTLTKHTQKYSYTRTHAQI